MTGMDLNTALNQLNIAPEDLATYSPEQRAELAGVIAQGDVQLQDQYISEMNSTVATLPTAGTTETTDAAQVNLTSPDEANASENVNRMSFEEAIAAAKQMVEGSTEEFGIAIDGTVRSFQGLSSPEDQARLQGAIDEFEAIERDLGVALSQIDDPDLKMRIQDFKKVISDALKELKELIIQMQVEDAEKGKELSQAESEERLDQIDKQKEQMEQAKKDKAELEKRKEAQKWLKIGLAIAGFILGVAMAAVTGGAAAFAVAVIIGAVLLADACCEKSFIQEACQNIEKDMEAAGWSDGMKIFVKMTVVVAACALLAAVGGGATSVELGATLLQQSEVLTDFYKASFPNMSDKDAQIAAMVTMAALMIVTIAVSAKMMAKKASEIGKYTDEAINNAREASKNATTLAGRAGNKIKQIRYQINQKYEQLMSGKSEKIFDWSMMGAEAMTGAVQVGACALQYDTAMMQARMTRQQGEYDAEITELMAQIKILRKIIDSLLEGLSGLGEEAAAVEDAMKGMHQSDSKIITNLFNAG